MVEGEVITASEVRAKAGPILERLNASGSPANPARIYNRVLDSLIMRILQRNKAKQFGIVASDRDVMKMAAGIARKNGVSPQDMPKIVAQQGGDWEDYLNQLRDDMIKTQLLRRVIRPLVSVSEEELRDLYESAKESDEGAEERRVGQILIALDERAPELEVEKAYNRAEELAQQLRDGGSLATLASQHSDDPSGLNGGDMGWFKRGELLPEMERALFELTKGEISKPLRSPQGFHVFKLLDVRRDKSAHAKPAQQKVHASHILIKLERDASEAEVEAALQQIQAIRQKIVDGANFAQMAKEVSEGPSGANGGDLGFFGKGEMTPPFEQAAFALEVGQVSEPVRTEFGWHLILVEERQSIDGDSFEAQRDALRRRLLEARTKARFSQWLRDLRLRAYVEKY
ncbi:putative PpiC-type peptidyl-prolyl cis-trans isomerase [Magnetofaba australis IT-1]|uniref:Putative PpiC-type peptidyl-prolyl cis-trans isomerase n=1 Tax=Magnetofaba australis IT-1 TaxID=1434232 RepID=A0A1Y2K6I3_9PROT|nr:putative PpiC-type peptidyl-prolyl cis-trans isomerase [Magnetofaba australis IT-1]